MEQTSADVCLLNMSTKLHLFVDFNRVVHPFFRKAGRYPWFRVSFVGGVDLRHGPSVEAGERLPKIPEGKKPGDEEVEDLILLLISIFVILLFVVYG